MWFSVILRPDLSPRKVGLLQILAATSVRAGIEELTGARVALKWPNDLVLGARKLGGILVETKTVGNTLLFAILGIGVNVNQQKTLLPKGAVSLYTYTKRKTDLQILLSKIGLELQSKYAGLEHPATLSSEWWDFCSHKLQPVHVQTPDGTIDGLCKGITLDGRLIVETEDASKVSVEQGTLRVLN